MIGSEKVEAFLDDPTIVPMNEKTREKAIQLLNERRAEEAEQVRGENGKKSASVDDINTLF